MTASNLSRFDDFGEWRFMAQHSNYVMARRKGDMPAIFSRRAWDAMAKTPKEPGE